MCVRLCLCQLAVRLQSLCNKEFNLSMLSFDKGKAQKLLFWNWQTYLKQQDHILQSCSEEEYVNSLVL